MTANLCLTPESTWFWNDDYIHYKYCNNWLDWFFPFNDPSMKMNLHGGLKVIAFKELKHYHAGCYRLVNSLVFLKFVIIFSVLWKIRSLQSQNSNKNIKLIYIHKLNVSKYSDKHITHFPFSRHPAQTRTIHSQISKAIRTVSFWQISTSPNKLFH